LLFSQYQIYVSDSSKFGFEILNFGFTTGMNPFTYTIKELLLTIKISILTIDNILKLQSIWQRSPEAIYHYLVIGDG
jgi:hypothetical protein